MKIAFRKKCHTIYAKIICFWTFGKYSHSELVFSDGTTFSSDEADGGTRWKDELEKPEEWDFIDIPCNKTQEKEIRRFCEGEDGLKYDMAGIGFSFLPIPVGWQSAEKWFCSEICAAALQQIGYLVGYTPSRISPNKLYSLLKSERRFRIKSLPLSLLTLLLLTGCAAVETTSEILDIIYDDPEPVCGTESVGLQWKGETCLKYSDGAYRWRPTE